MEFDRMLRIAEVLRITGVSAATTWRWVKSGCFPSPVKLGPNSVAWRESEIQAWLESRQPVVDDQSRTGGDAELEGAP